MKREKEWMGYELLHENRTKGVALTVWVKNFTDETHLRRGMRVIGREGKSRNKDAAFEGCALWATEQ